MAQHRCCPGDCDPCDCDECNQCCWAPGDKVEYSHTWGGFTVRETIPPLAPLFPPKCFNTQFASGSMSVTYTMIECKTVLGEFAIIFQLDTGSGTGITYNKALGLYEVKAGGGKYPLFPKLVLFCGTGDGDRSWAGADELLLTFYDPAACVVRCSKCIGAVSATIACDCEGFTAFDSDPCNSSGGGLLTDAPCQCKPCVARVDECDGMIQYCLFAFPERACACTSGNYYAAYGNPAECGFGCPEDAVSAGNTAFIVETCDVRAVDVLEISPVGLGPCRWSTTLAECIPKGSCNNDCTTNLDPSLSQPSYPITVPARCPDGFPGDCDCFSVTQDYLDNCAPEEVEGLVCSGGGGTVIGSCP